MPADFPKAVPLRCCRLIAVSFFGGNIWLSRRPWTHDIDGGGIERVLDVSGVEFLDHLNAGTAVLGNLVDVSALRQAHANVGMAEAVSRPFIAVAIKFEVGAPEDAIKQFDVVTRKDGVDRLRIFPGVLHGRHAIPVLATLAHGLRTLLLGTSREFRARAELSKTS